MPHVVFVGELFAMAGFFALVEIQVEGADGWAAKLPTWKIDNALTRRLISGKPLTGYHFWLFLFMLAAVHLPYGLGLVQFDLSTELRILAFFILFWILEDFLWFVFNPAFGIRAFRKDRIWWHEPAWWWVMPKDYWLFGPIGLLLYLWSL